MLPYPFDSLQVSFQQAVQGEGDDVVHVLELEEERDRMRGYVRGFQTSRRVKVGLLDTSEM